MPETPLSPDRDAASAASIDPTELEIALRVIDAASSLDPEDPAYIALRRQTGKLYKDVKRQSRKEKRQRIADADRAVVAATATGAADRIDDETRGIPLATRTTTPFAGSSSRRAPATSASRTTRSSTRSTTSSAPTARP